MKLKLPEDGVLRDLAFWEVGVCLSCGDETDSLENEYTVVDCETCGLHTMWPASLVLSIKDALEDAESAPF